MPYSTEQKALNHGSFNTLSSRLKTNKQTKNSWSVRCKISEVLSSKDQLVSIMQNWWSRKFSKSTRNMNAVCKIDDTCISHNLHMDHIPAIFFVSKRLESTSKCLFFSFLNKAISWSEQLLVSDLDWLDGLHPGMHAGQHTVCKVLKPPGVREARVSVPLTCAPHLASWLSSCGSLPPPTHPHSPSQLECPTFTALWNLELCPGGREELVGLFLDF